VSIAVAVQVLSAISRTMAPLLDRVWAEHDRATYVVGLAITALKPVLRSRLHSNAPLLRGASQVLAALRTAPFTFRAWRKDAWELFLEAEFFLADPRVLSAWRVVVDVAVAQERGAFEELLFHGQSLATTLFSTREVDALGRCRFLKRIGFALISGELDQYTFALPLVQEQLVSALKPVSPHPSVITHVFLIFRVLVRRVTAHNLVSVWPFVLFELTRFLGGDQNNPQVMYSALRFLDLALLINAEDLLPHIWAFIARASSPADTALVWIPSVNSLGERDTQEEHAAAGVGQDMSLVRPLLGRQAETDVTLSTVTSAAKALAARWRLRGSRSMGRLDSEFVDTALLAEFSEVP